MIDVLVSLPTVLQLQDQDRLWCRIVVVLFAALSVP